MLKDSVFNKTGNAAQPESIPCREAHTIDGIVPKERDLSLDGRTCDCGKLVFRKVWCDCSAENRHHELRAFQNEV